MRCGPDLPCSRSRLVLAVTFRVLSTASFAAALCLAPATALHGQATEAPAAASGAVTVLEAGAAPLQLLRYRLVKGAGESFTTRQKISMNMEMGAMALPPQSFPATLITTRLSVAEVTADGTATVNGEIVNVDVDAEGADPMLVNATRPALMGMNGLSMSYNLSPSGRVSSLEFGAGAPAAMQSLGAIEQFSVAFPSEPVGVGARWQATRQVKQNGMSILQDVDYVVRSLAGDSMVLELNLTQSAKDQAMDVATMPAGASATLRSLDGTGTASVTIHFNRAQPVMDMRMEVRMIMDLDMGGQLNTMNQLMVMETTTVPVGKP